MPESPIPELLRALAEEFAVLLERMPAQEQEKVDKKRKDRLPSSPEAKALADLFRRKHTTPWSVKEIVCLTEARASGELTCENIALLAFYYEQERKKGSEGCHRRDLETCVRNYLGELDRARNSPAQRRLERASAKPRVIVPMEQPTSDAERERLAAAARELRERTGM